MKLIDSKHKIIYLPINQQFHSSLSKRSENIYPKKDLYINMYSSFVHSSQKLKAKVLR